MQQGTNNHRLPVAAACSPEHAIHHISGNFNIGDKFNLREGKTLNLYLHRSRQLHPPQEATGRRIHAAEEHHIIHHTESSTRSQAVSSALDASVNQYNDSRAPSPSRTPPPGADEHQAWTAIAANSTFALNRIASWKDYTARPSPSAPAAQVVCQSGTFSDTHTENVDNSVGLHIQGETCARFMNHCNVARAASDIRQRSASLQARQDVFCWKELVRPPAATSLVGKSGQHITANEGILSTALPAVGTHSPITADVLDEDTRKIGWTPSNRANPSNESVSVDLVYQKLTAVPFADTRRNTGKQNSCRQLYVYGGEKMEADDAVASANALLAATAAREGLCSCPAEIQADGTIRWNSIYCKHYLFGRCARRRCRFVHGDRETVMQQRRLLEMATAAAAGVAATFESQTGCSTGTSEAEQLGTTSASESRAHSVSIHNASGRLLSSAGFERGVVNGSVDQVAATNAVVAGISITDADVEFYSKQRVQSHPHLHGRAIMNVSFTEAEKAVSAQAQHRGGVRASGRAGREFFRRAGSAVAVVDCVESMRRGEVGAMSNQGSKPGRIDQTVALYAGDKYGVAPRLLPTAKTRLQPSKSSDNPTRIALSTEERCACVDVTGHKSRPVPQTTPLSFLQRQQQRLSRVPSAPCWSQPMHDCYRHTLSGVRGSLAVEESEVLHPIESFAASVQGTDHDLRPLACRVPLAVSTVPAPGHCTREHTVGGVSCSRSQTQEVSTTPRMIPTWKPFAVQPDAPGGITRNSAVFASSLKSRSGALPSVASFSAAADKHKVAEGAAENFFPSRGSQFSEAEPPKLAFDVGNVNDLYILVGESKTASCPAPSLALSRDQSVRQPAQQGQQAVSSTYRLFDFTPQEDKGDCGEGSIESTQIPMCSSTSRLFGYDKLFAEASDIELRSHSEHRLTSISTNRSGFLTAGGKTSRKKIAPIGRVDPITPRLESSAVHRLSFYRAVSQRDKAGLRAVSTQIPECQKETRWHTGESCVQSGNTASKGRDITMTGDIRFVQAAESLSERYGMPFMCVFVPQRGYVIQFLEGPPHCVRSVAGLTSSCPDSEHLKKTISELVKCVLDNSEYVLGSSASPVNPRPPPTAVGDEKVCGITSAALPQSQTPTATQTALTAGDRLHAFGQSGAEGLSVFASSGSLWNMPHAGRLEKEDGKNSVDAVAQDIGRSSTLIESNGAPTASLLSVLSSLPELDLVETKGVEAGGCRLEGQQGNGVVNQMPASPLNLTGWLERQQSSGQPARRLDPSDDRFFTLLNVSAGQNSLSACPETENLHALTAPECRAASVSAISSATPAACGGESPKKSANQAVAEPSNRDEIAHTLVSQKAVEQREPLQTRKRDARVNHAVMHLMTLGPEVSTFPCLQAPHREHRDDAQQQESWQLWQTTAQDVRSSSSTVQDGGDNSEGNNASTAYGSFWSLTASGSLPSSHRGRGGTSENNLSDKDDGDKTLFRSVPHPRTPVEAAGTGLRYTNFFMVQEMERKPAMILSRTYSGSQCGATNGCQKVFTESIRKARQWQHTAPRSQSVSGCEGARIQLLTQKGSERGTRWKRSGTADELSSSPRCVRRALTPQ